MSLTVQNFGRSRRIYWELSDEGLVGKETEELWAVGRIMDHVCSKACSAVFQVPACRHVRARGDWTHAAKLDRDDRIPAMYNAAVALKDDDKEKLEVAI